MLTREVVDKIVALSDSLRDQCVYPLSKPFQRKVQEALIDAYKIGLEDAIEMLEKRISGERRRILGEKEQPL